MFVTGNHVFLVLFFLIFIIFLTFSYYGIYFDLVFCTIIFCVRAGISTLMSVFDGLHPCIFHRNMENTRCMREEMDGKVFIFRQSRHFSFVTIMIEILSLFVP